MRPRHTSTLVADTTDAPALKHLSNVHFIHDDRSGRDARSRRAQIAPSARASECRALFSGHDARHAPSRANRRQGAAAAAAAGQVLVRRAIRASRVGRVRCVSRTGRVPRLLTRELIVVSGQFLLAFALVALTTGQTSMSRHDINLMTFVLFARRRVRGANVAHAGQGACEFIKLFQFVVPIRLRAY